MTKATDNVKAKLRPPSHPAPDAHSALAHHLTASSTSGLHGTPAQHKTVGSTAANYPPIPGHEHPPVPGRGPTPGGPKRSGSTIANYPPIPGHEHPPVNKGITRPGSHPQPKPKPKPKPVGGHHKPAPTSTKPAAPPSPPKAQPAPIKTSSPEPNTGIPSAGFDLASFLPMLLIAGAIIAGIYLYSHRKGR